MCILCEALKEPQITLKTPKQRGSKVKKHGHLKNKKLSTLDSSVPAILPDPPYFPLENWMQIHYTYKIFRLVKY